MIQPPPVLDALRRLARQGPAEASDADLLRRYVTGRDESAFEALVRRHGGLVWGACRRRLRDPHAAEDAFQTTFLALARHAASVRRPDALGAWLHRVAVRCSAAFRPTREPMAAPPPDVPAHGPDPAAAASGRELERLIDAEIDRLPEPFRMAFVLCEVEQRTAADAARAIGCPVGTVESRLTRARARLRSRLSRRGLTVGGLIGLGLAAGPVPASARTAAIALGTGAAPAPAVWAALADRAVRAVSGMTLGVGLVGGVVLIGLGSLVWTMTQASPSRPTLVPGTAARVSPDVTIPLPDQFRRNRFNFPLPPEAIARVGDPWLRHGAVPLRMSFSGDGRFLAAAGPGDCWLRVWDLATGRPRAHLPLAAGEVPAAVALTEDGGILRALVYTGEPRAAQLREFDTFRALEIRRRQLTDGPPDTAAFGPNGKQLVVANGGKIRLLEASTAVEVWRSELAAAGRVELAFAPTGGRIAALVPGTDRVHLIDPETGRSNSDLHDAGAALSLPTFSSDGRRLAVWCSTGQRLRVWGVGSRKAELTVSPGYPIAGLAFSPTGDQVAAFAGSRFPILWPARADSTRRELRDCMGGVSGQFSPDGRLLAVATPYGAVQIVDTGTGRLNPLSQNHVLTPTPAAYSDDRLLVDIGLGWFEYATSGDDPPRVLDPRAGPDGPFIFGAADLAAVSPDRSLIARCNLINPKERQYALDLVDSATLAPRGRIAVEGLARRPTFSPDGRVLYAICADRLLHGWDVRTGQEVMRGKSRAGDLVSRLLVSSDGRYLATAVMVFVDVQRENSIQVWDAATGESLFSAEAGQARPYIAFSPDGKQFAATAVATDPQANAHEVRVWDLATRKVVTTLPGYDGQPAFSPDGRTVAVTRDDSVILLELATGKPRHAFRHHGKVEPELAWRADGRVIAAASAEAPVYLWDVVGDRTAPVPEWNSDAVELVWDAFRGNDAPDAFQAVRHLWAHPQQAVTFLKERVIALADARLTARACEVLELIATADAKALLTTWAAGPADALRTKEAKESLRRSPAK